MTAEEKAGELYTECCKTAATHVDNWPVYLGKEIALKVCHEVLKVASAREHWEEIRNIIEGYHHNPIGNVSSH